MAAHDTPHTQTSHSQIGFSLFVATMALILALCAVLAVAFKLNENGSNALGSSNANAAMSAGVSQNHPMMAAGGGSAMAAGGGSVGAAITGSGATENITIIVKSDDEHAKKGPEGTWHDAFLPANFTVKPGATVTVTAVNYDEGAHSFTSPTLGTNVIIPAGSAKHPRATTFTFHAPKKAGNYLWYCNQPCDPFSMSHIGFMRGYVKVA